MRLYEFQAKELFRQFGILPSDYRFKVVSSIAAGRASIRHVGRGPWIAKAQVLAGGRGKAGGIRRIQNFKQAPVVLKELLGKSIVNAQTGPKGEKVRRVLLEKAQSVRREFYLGIVQDRKSARALVLASSSGGMEIEEVARQDPSKVIHVPIDPLMGLLDHQARGLAFTLGLGPSCPSFCRLLIRLSEFYVKYDCTLVEINPLAEVGSRGDLLPLDAKVVIDDNSLFRQPGIVQLRKEQNLTGPEARAIRSGISYVGLSGNVGCLVNGAGLAMATMDLIKSHGGEPANFLDVGGGASVEQVKNAFGILLSDRNVKAVLVNIFGGIMKCDTIAQALTRVVKAISLKVPLVVRLEGTRLVEGKKILRESGLRITTSDDLSEAARLAVQMANA